MIEYNDYCHECTANGDNYFLNEEDELECRCDECPFNEDREYEMYD